MSRPDLLCPPQVHVVGPTPSPTPSPRGSPAPGSGYRSVSASPNRSRRSTVSSQATLFFADDGLRPPQPVGSPYLTSTTPVSPAWTYGASAGTSPASVFPLLDDCGNGSSPNAYPSVQLYPPCYDLHQQSSAKQNQAGVENAFWDPHMCSPWEPPQPGWDGELTSVDHGVDHDRLHPLRSRAFATSTASLDAPSSAGSTFSPVRTDRSDTVGSVQGLSRCASPLSVDDKSTAAAAARGALVCLGPQCHRSFPSEDHLKAHVKAVHSHSCNWAGCRKPSFAGRDSLVWHVKAEHLLICPVPGCAEASFRDTRTVRAHLVVAHPDVANDDGVKEWQLEAPTSDQVMSRSMSAQSSKSSAADAQGSKEDAVIKELLAVSVAKRKCHDQLRTVVEKKAKRNSTGTPRGADSPSDLVRARASKLVEAASFPLIFEHSVLPFLVEFLPKWTSPRHIINVARGRTSQSKRLCITTPSKVSLARKVIIAGHVGDLLPEKFKWNVSFVFSVGEVVRSRCWARGMGGGHLDDICHPRNPHHFRYPSMGDSIGIPADGNVREATATLGPSVTVDGGSYWLANFHPFLEAYRSVPDVSIQHPSPQDRALCAQQGHDVLDGAGDFTIGHVRATSGLNLRTTRVSHDPYWEENLVDNPLVTMDWVLIGAGKESRGANMLRRFPSETQAPYQEPLVRSASANGAAAGVVPGAVVVSCGRTSGYQRGQVCEMPAYLSAASNGTGKATREWFIEEPPGGDSEEDWIRGGIGIEGDSGAAIVDAETHTLFGQLWGRNKYWGPGPRITWFTPITDIFDDIQEKCRTDGRPQLPQHREEADRYPVYPSCRQCYDLMTYVDTRRSSRASLQSMMMGAGDGDQDETSVEAVSELATPRDYARNTGVEEVGASFKAVSSPVDSRIGPGTPMIAADMIKSPYPQTLDLDEAMTSRMGCCETPVRRKRPLPLSEAVANATVAGPSKRNKLGW